MPTTRTLTGIKALAVGAAFAALLAPSFAFAQTDIDTRIRAACDANPASCTDPAQAFDPEINPVLKFRNYTVNLHNNDFDAAGKPIPKINPEDGACVLYNTGGGAVGGCLKDGRFTIEGFIVGGAGPTGDVTATSVTSNSEGQTTAAPVGQPDKGTGACSIDNPGTWADCLLKGIAVSLLTFTNFLLAIAGTLFNWAVVKTVFQFSQFIGNSEGLLLAWGIMRDIANILILFGFILIGVGTILNTDRMPNKKMLPNLVIFAVLINFSLFAVEAIIDTSNVLSAVMYQQVNTDPCGPDISQRDCAINYGIAGHIMQSTGLASALAVQDPSKSARVDVMLGLVLFSLIGAVVLFAGAIMIIIRAVILSFLMALAPIGFAGLVVPKFESIAKGYWNSLLKQSFFAPIFLLLVFISLKITDGFSSEPGANGSLAAALTHADTSIMGVFLVFFSVIGFLVFSLIAAQRFGAIGAESSIKAIGGMTFGTAGFVGRRTLGQAAYKQAENIRKSNLGRTEFGRMLAGSYDSVAKSSFDVRANKQFGAALKKQKINLGEPSKSAKGGFKQVLDDEVEKRKKYASSLKETDEEKALRMARERERTVLDSKGKKDEALLKSLEKETKDRWTATRDGLVKERNEMAPGGPLSVDAQKQALAREREELERGIQADTPESRAALQNQMQVERMKAESMRQQFNAAGATEAEENARRLQAQLDSLGAATEQRKQRLAEVNAQMENVEEAHAQRMEEIRTRLSAGEERYNSNMDAILRARYDQQEKHKKVMEGYDKETKKVATPQGRYAARIENSKIPGPLNKKMKKEVVDKILDDIKINKSAKTLQSLKDAFEKAGVKDADKQVEAAQELVAEAAESTDGGDGAKS